MIAFPYTPSEQLPLVDLSFLIVPSHPILVIALSVTIIVVGTTAEDDL